MEFDTVLSWWLFPALPSPEESEYLEWEMGIYFYNKFSDNWNVGMPAKVSELISGNLWLLDWKMKEEQPSTEPHSCGRAQLTVLIVIKGCQNAPCLGSQSDPQMSSDAQFFKHQHCFSTMSLNPSLLLHVTPKKRENGTPWINHAKSVICLHHLVPVYLCYYICF